MRILFLLAILIPTTAQAKDPKWTLQFDPLTAGIGYWHVQVERAIHPHVSVYAGPHLRLAAPLLGKDEDFTSIGIEMGVRYFFQPTAPVGWWMLLRGVVAHLETPTNDTATGGYISGLGGYTHIFADWFVLAGGAGVQYLHLRVGDVGSKRVFLALHTAIGVAF